MQHFVEYHSFKDLQKLVARKSEKYLIFLNINKLLLPKVIKFVLKNRKYHQLCQKLTTIFVLNQNKWGSKLQL